MVLVGREHDIDLLRSFYRRARTPSERNSLMLKAEKLRKEAKDKYIAQLRYELIKSEVAVDADRAERIRTKIRAHMRVHLLSSD